MINGLSQYKWLVMGIILSLLMPLAQAQTNHIILAEDNFAPFSNNQGKGLSNEIVAAAFNAAGIKIQFEVYPFSRLMLMVKDGAAAGGMNAVPTPENRKHYIFGKHPIYISHQRFFYHIDQPIRIDSEQDILTKLANKKITIGEVLGYIYPPSYEAMKDDLLLLTNAVRSDENLVKMLQRKRIKVGLMTTEVAEYHIKRFRAQNQLAYGLFEWEAPLYIAFSRKHPKGQFLADQFDKGMSLIKQNGSYQRLVEQYRTHN